MKRNLIYGNKARGTLMIKIDIYPYNTVVTIKAPKITGKIKQILLSDNNIEYLIEYWYEGVLCSCIIKEDDFIIHNNINKFKIGFKTIE